MNCKQAHEIMNLILDGEAHPLEASAREHIQACPECRQWLAGMEHVTGCMASALDRMPQIDISAAVMARLPERHPASVERRDVLVSRRALAWMCAGWAFGLVTMLLIGLLAMPWLTTPSVGRYVVAGYTVSRTILGSVGSSVSALKPLGVAAMGLLRSYEPQALGLVRAWILLECIALGLAYLFWRARSKASGSTSVMI